jgi:hypothetical protein
MHRFQYLLVALLMGMMSAAAAPRAGAARDSAGAIAMQRAWWQALVLADTASLRALSTSALVVTLSSGQTFDRAGLLADAARHTKGREVKITWADEAIRPVGSNVALVTSRVTEVVGPTASVYRYVTVLERRGADWRVTAAQSTRELAFTPRVGAGEAGPLVDFTGAYQTPRGQALRVVARDSALLLVEPSGIEIPVEPIGPGLFEFTVLSPSNGVVRLAFTRDATGRVTAMTRLLSGSVNTFPRIGVP